MNENHWTLFQFKALTETAPELGSQSRPEAKSEQAVAQALESFKAETTISEECAQLLLSLALLWHDHLDASHRISQQIQHGTGSFLHGVMHRREPDFSNSKYWFHRTGNHPAFPEIVARAKPIIDANSQFHSFSRMIESSTWNPFAFVDACEQASSPSADDALIQALRKIQAIELETLGGHILSNF